MREMAQVAAGHIDWRKWVNGRVIDSLDADMEGGDFLRKGEALELAELLVRAEAKLYTDSQVGEGGEQAPTCDSSEGERPVIGDDIGGPAAPDATLDEIVRDCFDSLNPMVCGDPQNDMDHIRAACLRARASEQREVAGLRSKLAAVRAWADDQVSEIHADLGRLDAILDGKGADHE